MKPQYPRKQPDRLISLKQYPGLQEACWNRHDETISEKDAFHTYERNWRYLNINNLTDEEIEFIIDLDSKYGNGVTLKIERRR